MKPALLISSAALFATGLHARDALGPGGPHAAVGAHDGVGSIEGRILLEGGPVPEWDSVTNAIVFLVGEGLGTAEPPPGAPTPVLEQRDYTFIPNVLAIRHGVELMITNHDTVTHNIHMFTKGRGRTAFNRAQTPGVTVKATFRRPDTLLVLCDIHSHMQAHILVLSNSFFTKPGGDGSFLLAGVPAGTYELSAWHTYYAAQREVQVVAGETTRADIHLTATPRD